MNKLLDKYMPWKKLTNKEYKRRFKPWINNHILNKISLKNKKFKKYIRCKNPSQKETLRNEFKALNYDILTLTRNSKREYYHKYFTENKNNLQKIWTGIKEVINIKNKVQSHPTCITNKDGVVNNPKKIANCFNDFFCNIAEDIMSKRKYAGNTSHRNYLHNEASKTFVAYECDEREVSSLISTLNPRKGIGPNSLPTSVLHILKDEISLPISIIFNISITTGTFPRLLKTSKTIPVYKKGSKLKINNYRPISLLSNINKIFEKLMFNRVYKFLELNRSIYDLQFGFRAKHGTNHALIEITEKIRCALDNHEFACGIFIDLQKAFDTVNHNILLDKLEHYGLRGVVNKWFKSYLSNRHQFVSIDGYESDLKEIKHGVPQGSVLGPLLFLIYINDLHNAIFYSRTYHFADDTHLLNINKCPKKMQKQMNLDLRCLYKWLLANKISLNCSKTELIIFHSKRNQTNSNRIVYFNPITKSSEIFTFNIKINGHRIFPSESIKYLGIYLDRNLTWQDQCKVLMSKLNRANGMLSKVRHYVPQRELVGIYHAIFTSHLMYNCEVWAQQNSILVNKIAKLQNKAMQIINFKSFDTPSNLLYIETGMLKFRDIIRLKNCLFVHDFLTNTLPQCFADDFKTLFQNGCHHQTRNSNLGLIFLPTKNTTTYGIQSITYSSITCWNTVSHTYQENLLKLSRNTLRKKLTHFFTNELRSLME